MKYIRQYPKDKDLRRFHFEQTNWMDFKQYFVRDNVHTPPQIKRDARRMHEIEKDDKDKERKKSEIILPKINKRA